MNRLSGNKYVLIAIVFSAMVALLIHFPELLSLVAAPDHLEMFPTLDPIDIATEAFFGFITLLLMFGYNHFIFDSNRFRKSHSSHRLALSMGGTMLLSLLSSKGFVVLHHSIGLPAIDSTIHHYLHPMRSLIITSVVVGSSYMVYLIRQRQAMQLENEQLRAENMIHQYEVLKNQLNPHMLFNSLNTLQSLVRMDRDKASCYIGELSRVLRYTLQGNENSFVSLKEEMAFVQSYIFLQKMRYEEDLLFKIEIPEPLLHRYIPPMSVQILIENAIKHNEISSRRPLTITITANFENTLRVENPQQPRSSAPNGTGIGLDNLNKRCELLLRQSVTIQSDERLFAVTVPLIDESTALS